MLLIPLPAWLTLGILQLPLGRAQVRTLVPPIQSPCRPPPHWGLLRSHLSHPSAPSPPRVGGYGTAMVPTGLPRVRGDGCGAFLLQQQDDAKPTWGIRAAPQHPSAGAGPSRGAEAGADTETGAAPTLGWGGRGSAQGRASKPTPEMLPAWQGPPRLRQGGGGVWRVMGMSLCPPRSA